MRLNTKNEICEADHVSPLTKLKILEIKNPGIFLKYLLFLYRRTITPGSPNVTRMVPDGPPMLWGPSGIARDVSGTSVMPLDVCVKVADGRARV